MVKQGDIIKVSFDPQSGHEQVGYRPALVVSNNIFNNNTNLVLVCPISNTKSSFPLHIPLDSRTQTSGSILCQHIRSLDINARKYIFIETLPDDILKKVIGTVIAEIN
ncbi:MAG: type II toxin-antitoxin system PemK/MazF family toxin [Ruminococcus flavefaciens]|nr:type II toxin-antitoxin system PemK/MazF family toxin [Ruminococcus flavefaciens]